jgi:hypothetical protein
MHIYLAARYSRHPEMAKHAKKIEKAGHRVTSRWIRGSHSLDESIDRGQSDEVRANFAIEDIEDLTKADVVISFTEEMIEQVGRPSKGGRHVEFGMGVALNKRMVVIGPREHVFHWLPNVEHYGSVAEFLSVLNDEEDAALG